MLAAPVKPAAETGIRTTAATGFQSTIGKGLVFEGDITGSEPLESLLIEGSVLGTIHLPDSRVMVGRNGKVNAGIFARDIVVMGWIEGNVIASERVDIRAQGAVTGQTSAPRIMVEDGAFVKGAIDICKKVAEPVAAQAETVVDELKIDLDLPAALHMKPQARSLPVQQSL